MPTGFDLGGILAGNLCTDSPSLGTNILTDSALPDLFLLNLKVLKSFCPVKMKLEFHPLTFVIYTILCNCDNGAETIGTKLNADLSTIATQP